MSGQHISRVFISAVSCEFKSYREAVSQILLTRDVFPVTQEYFGPDATTIADLLRDKIKGCDAVICILGRVYGFEPKSIDPGSVRRSYTQMEYDIALEFGKRVFLFKATDQCPVDQMIDESKELRTLQENYVRQLTSTDELWTEFSSVDDLAKKISLSTFLRGIQHENPIVAKGLRSFEAADSSFFLQLLPGSKDGNLLPESIRFWKDRIEARDGSGFQVGIMYGPSGCGKSSLVKAGLIPHLSSSIAAIYVEADSIRTEARLLQRLANRFPVFEGQSLSSAIQQLAIGKLPEAGRKVLLILDQFEQWLLSNSHLESSELSRAISMCDGDHVQCIVMVRDDFWSHTSRFMKQVGELQREGENTRMVDLFEPSHARRVLAKLGHAMDCWPAEGTPLTAEQEAFLEQAVNGLAENNRVVSVHLALSAEMLKDRPWNLATLKEVGGMKGLGITFLEQTFGDRAQNRRHLDHQQGAIAILRTLLPDPGTRIRGRMRSLTELREAAEYREGDPRFNDLIQLMDFELRLITPAAFDAVDSQPSSDAKPTADQDKYYQLTHDFLVKAIRDWLPTKLQQSRAGRAELLLATRASHWETSKESRFLPSAREMIIIRLLTRQRQWTATQHEMMQAAGRHHSIRGVILALGLVLAVGISLYNLNAWKAQRANGKLATLFVTDVDHVPDAIEDLSDSRPWADPLLMTAFQDGKVPPQVALKSHSLPILSLSSPKPRVEKPHEQGTAEPLSDSRDRGVQLRAALALLPTRTAKAANEDHDRLIVQMILDGDPKTILLVRSLLKQHGIQVQDRLWHVLEDPDRRGIERFHAAMALAVDRPPEDSNDHARWLRQAPFVAYAAIDSIGNNLIEIERIVESLAPVGDVLYKPLLNIFHSTTVTTGVRTVAANMLVKFLETRPQLLADMIPDAETRAFEALFNAVQSHPDTVRLVDDRLRQKGAPLPFAPISDEHARRHANVLIALMRLSPSDASLRLLQATPDPLVRSHVIDRAARFGVPLETFLTEIEPPGNEIDVTSRRAWILAFGELDPNSLSDLARKSSVETLLRLYREHSDAGLHSATEWVLRNWKCAAELKQANEELRGQKRPPSQQWFVNSAGQTFAVISPGTFWMGSHQDDKTRDEHEFYHPVTIDHAFAMDTREVTNEELRKWPGSEAWLSALKDNKRAPSSLRDDVTLPAAGTSWNDAAKYCNWLSEKDGIDESEWCYENGRDDQMVPCKDFLTRTGYRLPTEEEWEYACRSGTITSRYFGHGEELLAKYACFGKPPADGTMSPAGSLKPNDWGLFDMLGNAMEWCQDEMPSKSATPDRLMRGLMYLSLSRHVRAARRLNLDTKMVREPTNRDHVLGFRPVCSVRQ